LKRKLFWGKSRPSSTVALGIRVSSSSCSFSQLRLAGRASDPPSDLAISYLLCICIFHCAYHSSGASNYFVPVHDQPSTRFPTDCDSSVADLPITGPRYRMSQSSPLRLLFSSGSAHPKVSLAVVARVAQWL
jgi:hypothetical protein